jgi:predicted DNA-binding transcriptional regulator YafY
MQILGDDRLHTAADLAQTLGVSERTIWRDMDRLRDAGLPIAGTRGAGYRITAPITMPPLSLTDAELEALQLGLAVLSDVPDEDLRRAATSLSRKIDAALSEDVLNATRPDAPFAAVGQAARHLPVARAAIRARQKLQVITRDGDSGVIRPLALRFWGRVWTLTGWSEAKGRFQDLRIDEVADLSPLPALFVDEPGKRLQDYDPDAARRSGTGT